MDSNQPSLIDAAFEASYTLWGREALDDLPESFTITDPAISGHPIVFASGGFLKMTGYSRAEVVGKNGRFFQGPATNRRSVMEIREAVREERPVQVSLVNYRKDGTPFWMLFQMCPLFGEDDGLVRNFVAVQVPIARRQRKARTGLGDGGSRPANDAVYGACRREVWSDSLVELGRVLAPDSDVRELEIEEHCEASDVEKRRAASAINDVLSVLTHYSGSTGRVVSAKRFSLSGAGHLSSSLTISLGRIKHSFVLIDNDLPGSPIVYASDAFLKLTGYARHEVLGHSCRFLNGADTDLSTWNLVEEGIQTKQVCTVRILSYRKDKSSFWNILHLSPVRNGSGKVILQIAYIVGVHMEDERNSWDGRGLSPEMRQLSAVGAVKVAVRTLSMGAGSSKS